jgi:hypothetical protein
LDQESEWQGFYRISGVLLIVGLVGGLGNIAIFATGPAPGTGVEATLNYTANNQIVFLIGNAVLGAAIFLLLPAIVAVYLAQRSFGRGSMLLGMLFGVAGMFVFLSLLPVLFSLPNIGQGYVTAQGDAQRSAYVTAGKLALSEVTSALVIFVFLMAVWTLIASVNMLKGVFGRRLGYLGLISGIGFVGVGINIVFPTPGLDFVDALSILWLVWLFGIGYKLFRLGASAR